MLNKDYLPIVLKDILEQDKKISSENLLKNLKIYYDYLETKEKTKSQENISRRKIIGIITISIGSLIIVISLFISFFSNMKIIIQRLLHEWKLKMETEIFVKDFV